MCTLPPSPWKEFLEEVDALVTEACTLPCFGGFVATQKYGLSRQTVDIDVLDVAPPHSAKALTEIGGKGSRLAIKHKVYLDIVAIANPPYDYQSRLQPMYEGAFRHLSMLTMDPYDVALTKLERDNDKDFQDVLELAERIPFDLDLFETRYREELREYTTGKPEDNDLVFYRWTTAIREYRAARHPDRADG